MINSGKLATAFIFLGSFLVAETDAQFTLSQTPPGGIVGIQGMTTFSVAPSPGSNYNIGTVTWTSWETAPNTTPPIASGAGPSISVFQPNIGTYTYQAVVTSGSQSNPNPPPPVTQTLACSVTVEPPDDFIIPTPTSVNFSVRGQQVYAEWH